MDSEKAVELLKKYLEWWGQSKENKEDEDFKAIETLLKEREELKDNNNKLIEKLMIELSPTNHDLDLTYQSKFKEIILNNLDKSNTEIRNLLKKCWED